MPPNRDPSSFDAPSAFSLLNERQRSHKRNGRRFQEEMGRTASMWDATQQIGELVGHEGCVNTINFNPTGSLIVSGSDDRTVRIWDTYTQKERIKLPGHVSNVFAANFLPHKCDREVISGSNDSDIRHFNLETGGCTVYRHHVKKVLRLSVNPRCPDQFLSCSADGTIRAFDIRQNYRATAYENVGESTDDEQMRYVVPQGFGGGRHASVDPDEQSTESSLMLHFRDRDMPRGMTSSTLFSVDCHPTDGYTFIVGAGDGNVFMFDQRKIEEKDRPLKCYTNIFRNIEHPYPSNFEVTGCVFDKTGRSIVATLLSDAIYEFDATLNYAEQCGVEFLKRRSRKFSSSHLGVESDSDDAADEDDNDDYDSDSSDPSSDNNDPEDVELFEVTPDSENENGEENGGSDEDERQIDPLSFEEIERSAARETSATEDEGAAERPLRRTPDMDRVERLFGAVARHLVSEGVVGPRPTAGASARAREFNKSMAAAPQTFVRRYEGHISRMTVKSCNFCGPESEYVISGSDDARIFIWSRATGALVRVLEGHRDVVNCIVPHPSEPMIISSGIDSEVILWGPSRVGALSDEELEERYRGELEIAEQNVRSPAGSATIPTLCAQQ